MGRGMTGGEEGEEVVRELVYERAAQSLYATRTEDKRRSRGKKKRGEIHYVGLFDAVTGINWDFTRFAAHALTVVPDEVYPRFYRFIDIDARKYLLLGDDEKPREGSAAMELRNRLQAIVDATEDGLRAEKKGKVWRVYVPHENWYVTVSRPSTHSWSIHVPLEGFWTEASFPEVLARTSPDVLRSLQRGWLLTDVTPPHGRNSDVNFSTTQPWQLPATLANFPGEVRLGVTAGVLGSTRASIKWKAYVHGYAEELGWASELIGEAKRAEYRRLVDECRALRGDSVALLTAFLGDGMLAFFLRLRMLFFRIGNETLYLPAKSAIVNVRLAVERASEYVRFVSLVTKNPKIRHFLFVGFGLPQKRGKKGGQRNSPFYANIAGARLLLAYVSSTNNIYARIVVDAVPQGWYEHALEEGWDVRIVASGTSSGGKEYYQVTQSSLFEHARYDAALRETLLAFAKAKAEQYPKAWELVERLEKLGTED
ncbi:hypothetical protein [Thermofilum pendens]|uniref:Uncharacterized protein n=1 Tax=Thermofilum pendens (strain DSM 2475 / Hrk 5) TaxID=368408 RepID=A1RXA2_THEPD|nr:hypothetical protein [Thermofilum pendens]ABL77832.1 hypothetical protein Tpen_0423 [Thermofilum pendens Hrk 5]